MKFPYPTVDAITPDLVGFYRISNDAYHAGPGLSSTSLKKALKGYTAYRARKEEAKDSSALVFGRAFHTLMLEPHLFSEQYAVMPKFDGHPNSNKHQEAKSNWLLENAGKSVLSASDSLDISAMVVAVKSHPESEKFTDFEAEVMGITRCQDTGLQIKCKADLFGYAIIDFKTTSTGVSPGEFMRDIIKWGYHLSAALYQDIIAALTGQRLPFVLVVVNKNRPFECEFYTLSDEILEEGRKLYKAALARIKRWEMSDPEAILSAEKRMRTLYPTPRMLYSTVETLEYVGGA